MSEPIALIKEQEQEQNNEGVIDYEILSEEHSEYDLAFKIIIIGNSGVGKSCLSVRATKNTFSNDYVSTIGFEYFKYFVKLNNENVIRLHIWDTCGQEIYRSLVSNYYKNSSLAIIVFSIDE